MVKVKRTYNLSKAAVQTVRELVEKDRIAPSQDAVVERAIRGLARRVRDAEHEKRWAELEGDAAFRAENDEIFHLFEEDDRTALDAGR
jgi:predicted metalloprotease